MKKIVIVLCVIFLIIATIIMANLLNPLRWKTTEEIRTDILEITPIGTSVEDVIKVIENKRWLILHEAEWKLLGDLRDFEFSIFMEVLNLNESVRAVIGTYQNFMKVYVSVTWKFDESLKVIDVVVRKQ